MEPPREVYARQLTLWQGALRRAEEGEDRAANARLAIFCAGLATAGAALAWDLSWLWLLVPLAAFAAAVVLHERRLQARRVAERAAAFYERGTARVEYRFAGGGDGGERFRPAAHPYADHLDLFGEGSLFEFLSGARTASGKETLARWLLAPAAPDEVAARQAAVRELAPRLELREDLAKLERKVVAALDADTLAGWGERPPAFSTGALRVVATGLVAVTLAAGGAWALGFAGPLPFIVAALVQGVFARSIRSLTRRVHEEAKAPAQQLGLVQLLLARIEAEEAGAPRLRELRVRLSSEGVAPSVRVKELLRRAEMMDWYANQLFAVVAPFLLWGTHAALAIETWRQRWGRALRPWIETVGEFEALLDLAAYAFEHPADAFPELVAAGPLLDARAVAHPLLAEDKAVRNDVRLGEDLRLIVITGSNMSGKSTLLRSVGTNAVLAQAGAPVRAASLRLSPLSVAASIRTVDSLRDGASRFFAEITALRGMVELADGGRTVLFLLDEMLHGTNSHDRRIGASGVMKGLLEKGAIGLLTTHDLALAELADELAPRVSNAHFESTLKGGELRFDYTLKPGVVKGSNALELMRAVGLDV